MQQVSSNRIFLILITSQFCGTSLWFAGNAMLAQLKSLYGWPDDAVGYLTSAVQLGFIAGTIALAVSGITDKFSPSRVFFLGSLAGCICNALSLLDSSSYSLLLTSRFLTGISLAGIYPVGMKIAADWREKGLGNWLGALVGALVLGTAFPQALKLLPITVNSTTLTLIVSCIALIGGVLVILFIPNGPYRKPASQFSFYNVGRIFTQPGFRATAFGYFGHMWELYAFWAFVPWAVNIYNLTSGNNLSVPLWSFIIIASGAFGCWLGGIFSWRLGSKRIALAALSSSGICCLFSVMAFQLPLILFLVFFIFWGFMVVADSPQFSALVAQHAPLQFRGTAITLTTCIGFSITIVSIQLLNWLQQIWNPSFLLVLLLPGPLFGILSLLRRTAQP